MSDQKDAYEKGVYYIRSSEHAAAITQELSKEGLRQPSDVLKEVKEQTGVKRSNFYDTLERIEGILVRKHDGPGRATLYELTDTGEQVAEDYDLKVTSRDDEAEYITVSADQPLSEILQNIKGLKRATVSEIQTAMDQIEEEDEPADEPTSTSHKTDDNIAETK